MMGHLQSFSDSTNGFVLECVGPSDISPFGQTKVDTHSIIASAAFSAFVEAKGMSQEYDEKLSRSISRYFSPVVVGAISM